MQNRADIPRSSTARGKKAERNRVRVALTGREVGGGGKRDRKTGTVSCIKSGTLQVYDQLIPLVLVLYINSSFITTSSKG